MKRSRVVKGDLESGPSQAKSEFPAYYGITDAWSECANMIEESDAEKVQAWSEEVDGFLNFSALFSAVVTVFLSQTYAALQQNTGELTIIFLRTISEQLAGETRAPAVIPRFFPQKQDVLLNSILFSSLFCSLIASGMGLWVKEWLREFKLDTPHHPRELARVRQYRHHSIGRWGVRHVVATIAFFLQLSVSLFSTALIGLVWTIDPLLRFVIIVLVGLWTVATLVTAICPSFSEQCPYKSPFARWVFHVTYFVRLKKFQRFNQREWAAVDRRGAKLDIEALEYLNTEYWGDSRLAKVNRCFKDVDVQKGVECIERLLAVRLACDRPDLANKEHWKKLPMKHVLQDTELLHLMKIWCRMVDGKFEMGNGSTSQTDLAAILHWIVWNDDLRAGREDSATVTSDDGALADRVWDQTEKEFHTFLEYLNVD